MQKHITNLSDAFEYFIGWTGQSNARRHGTRQQGLDLFGELELEEPGLDVVGITIPDDGAGGANRIAGYVEDLVVATTTIAAGKWNGAHLRLGTVTSPIAGYARVVLSVVGALRVEWIAPPTASLNNTTGNDGIITREDGKWRSYPNVRVLTPYQPVQDVLLESQIPYPSTTATVANGGRGLQLPGFTVPAGATSFADLAVLLPMSWIEGRFSYGISEASGGGACTGVAATTFNFTTATVVNYFHTGYLRVDWTDSGGAPKVSWSRIGDNTANQFTGLSWLGDGTPDFAGGSIDRWTAWVPHYLNSPYSYEPGDGFLYRNDEMQPSVTVQLYDRPRGVTAYGYVDGFADVLVFAHKLSIATGKRINIVHLGINGAANTPVNSPVLGAFSGTVGWWNYQNARTWAKSDPNSLWFRLVDLLTKHVPNALTAEGNTKTAKFLAWDHPQGESDAAFPFASARTHYIDGISSFVDSVRALLDSLGYNPYQNGAKVPFIQPKILAIYETIGGDTNGEVNSDIVERAEADEFGEWVFTEDLPRNGTSDVGHFNGVGGAAHAARSADRAIRLIEHALSFGTTATIGESPKLLDICNLALSLTGHRGRLTSLEDGSEEAALCKKYLPEARDTLLRLRRWGFALRRKKLVAIRRPEPDLFRHYGYTYVVPAEALNGFAVLPPVVVEAAFDNSDVGSTGYSTAFVAKFTPSSEEDTTTFPVGTTDDVPPIPYQIEQSPRGHRYLFTNQEQATLRYVARVVDAALYDSIFAKALATYLASSLAGSLVKGRDGVRLAANLMAQAGQFVQAASTQDNIEQKPDRKPFQFTPDHLAAR